MLIISAPMRPAVILRYCVITIVALVLVFVYINIKRVQGHYTRFESVVDFHGFNNTIPSPEFIVPNIVHFIRFGRQPLTFIDAVCLLAAWKNQKPRVIYVHTDQRRFKGGRYWRVVRSEVGDNVVLVYREKPTKVFGKSLSKEWRNWHAGDVARLLILMEYGGIFLDNDSYIVRSLDDFRRFEMTVGWEEKGDISNQVLIAHKDARFLNLWLESYKDYQRDWWFYNAGEKPTADILKQQPHLIHRVKSLLAEWVNTDWLLYADKNEKWREHYAIHLLIRHTHRLIGWKLSDVATYPVVFNEKNIMNYEVNIKYMALDVYPFNKSVF